MKPLAEWQGKQLALAGAGRQGVAGGIPFGAIDVVGRGVVALVAIARIHRLADDVGVASSPWAEA